jgi:hypothetical protein
MICRRDLGRRHSFWSVSASPCEQQQQYSRSQLPATSKKKSEEEDQQVQHSLQLERQQARFAHPSYWYICISSISTMCWEWEGGSRERMEGEIELSRPLSSFLFALRQKERERERARGRVGASKRQGKAKQSNIGKQQCFQLLWWPHVCGSSNMLEWVGDTLLLLPCMSINLANMYSFCTKINACLT